MKATTPTTCRLCDVLDDIENGSYSAHVDRLRAIIARGDQDAYNKEKVKLPSFYTSGTASSPATMLTHTGLLVVDLDGLDNRLTEIRSKLIADEHAAAVFISPSGVGLKTVLRIKPLDDPLDKAEHGRAFDAVTAYFWQCYGVMPDPSGRNVNRHCLVSYDPRLYRNAQATPFDWRANEREHEVKGEKRERDSSLSSQDSLCSLTSPCSLTSQPEPSFTQDTGDLVLFDSEQIEQAFAKAHPDIARLHRQLLGRRQRPKQRERNQCAVDISTFLVRAVSENNAMLMQGHWYDLYHRGRFNDTREQHLRDAKAQWDNALVQYPERLSTDERRRYLAIERADLKAAFRILRDCALSPRDEPPPGFHMSWGQLSTRLGVSSDKAGDILDIFTCSKIIKLISPPVMYGKGKHGRSTRYRWLLPTE